jgi:23S rRNA (guanosine2251-2'-O)-methyltransferase
MRKLKNEELGRLSTEEYKSAEKYPVCLLLDNVRSLNNVGSAFRTGDSFGIEKIYLVGITGTPPHRDINKTALGATETVAWEHAQIGADLVDRLKIKGYQIIAIEQVDKSISLPDFSPLPTGKYCFVFGNEVNGVALDIIEKADQVVEIPQFGTKHSLNVSVTIGVVLWDYLSKSGFKKRS